MGKRSRFFWTAVLGGGSLFLSGCNTLDVEDREFPLAVAVEEREDIENLWLNQEEAGEQQKDFNHLKVMILSRTLAENAEQMEELLGLLSANTEIPRNTYVVIAENPKEMLELNEKQEEEESAGNYLEELLEGNVSMKETAYPTLGKLYQERENRMETLFVPYLSTQNQMPCVEKYFIWKRGAAAGTADTPAAMFSAMVQGNLEKETIIFEGGNCLRISDFKVEETFEEEDGARKILVTIACDGKALYEKEEILQNRTGQYEEMLEDYYQQIADDMAREKVDVTNSYKKIGGYMREWYSYYMENAEAFETEVSVQIEIELNLIS